MRGKGCLHENSVRKCNVWRDTNGRRTWPRMPPSRVQMAWPSLRSSPFTLSSSSRDSQSYTSQGDTRMHMHRHNYAYTWPLRHIWLRMGTDTRYHNDTGAEEVTWPKALQILAPWNFEFSPAWPQCCTDATRDIRFIILLNAAVPLVSYLQQRSLKMRQGSFWRAHRWNSQIPGCISLQKIQTHQPARAGRPCCAKKETPKIWLLGCLLGAFETLKNRKLIECFVVLSWYVAITGTLCFLIKRTFYLFDMFSISIWGKTRFVSGLKCETYAQHLNGMYMQMKANCFDFSLRFLPYCTPHATFLVHSPVCLLDSSAQRCCPGSGSFACSALNMNGAKINSTITIYKGKCM